MTWNMNSFKLDATTGKWWPEAELDAVNTNKGIDIQNSHLREEEPIVGKTLLGIKQANLIQAQSTLIWTFMLGILFQIPMLIT